MHVNLSFKHIADKLALINRESYFVKIHVVVTPRHIICLDTDNQVEFFRFYVDNLNAFYQKLWMLYWAMLAHDYSGIGLIRPKVNKRYSKKLFDLWKQANEKKSLTLSLRQ